MKNAEEAPETNSIDSGVLSNPLSFIHSGNYGWKEGTLSGTGAYGRLWLSRSINASCPTGLDFFNNRLNPQVGGSYRGYGWAVRCVGKSFTTLINTSYSMKSVTSEDNRDSGVLSNPLSFVHSGYAYWGGATLGGRNRDGNYWSIRSFNTTHSYALVFHNAYLGPQYTDAHGNGFAVRCESGPLQILHYSH